MKRGILTIFSLFLLGSGHITTAGLLSPHLSLSFEGGATRSFLVTDGLMTKCFAPTSGVEKVIRPGFGAGVHLSLGKYLGAYSGMGYRHFGQYTRPATVYFKDDEFEHDFESRVNLHYLTIPFIAKAGIRRTFFSVFARFGITPSLLVNKDFAWIIDGREVPEDSWRLPAVYIKNWAVPLHAGGEAGIHLGRNGIFICLEYNYGITSFARDLEGNAFLRSYGGTLQYRRELF
jgi:hypothetical protein